MNTLSNIQQRWAYLNKKLSDPTVSQEGRAVVRVELAKLKPVLTEVFTAAADGSTTKTQVQPAETKAYTKAVTFLRDFDFYVVPASQNLAVLVDKLFERWCATRKFKRAVGAERLQVYRKLIEGIVCNMVYAQAVNAEGVTVSRNRLEYRANSHYKPAIYTADNFLPLIDDSIQMHMLSQSLGDKWKRDYRKDFGTVCGGNNTDAKYLTQHLKRTALRMTETLRELCGEVAIRFAKEEVGFMRAEQEVILQKRDESSALVEYEETPLTTKYRDQMRQINRYLENAGPLVAPEYAEAWDDRQRFLTRGKSTYSSFTSGGRLWGAFWDSPMRKEQRSTILRINGEATVELDYRSMIVQLAYIPRRRTGTGRGSIRNPWSLCEVSCRGIKKLVSALLFDLQIGKGFRRYHHQCRISETVTRISDTSTTAKPTQNLLKLVSSSRLDSSTMAAMCCGESVLRSPFQPSNLSVVCLPTLSRKISKPIMVPPSFAGSVRLSDTEV